MIFIMAAGSQKRWLETRTKDLHPIKQLVDVYGIPLIERTMTQLSNKHLPFTIVTYQSEIINSHPDKVVFPRADKEVCLVENILNTSYLWKNETTVFLLGDVVFSNHSLDIILGQFQGLYRFYGGSGETYAFSIKSKGRDIIRKTSPIIIEDFKLGKQTSRWKVQGNLRDLRWYLRHGGLPDYKSNEALDRVNDPCFQIINDWTQDVDHLKGYKRLMNNRIAERHLKREKKENVRVQRRVIPQKGTRQV